MKRYWLRGLLLGVSLVLLLGGGVALAQQQMTAAQDQYCLPCWPYYFGPDGQMPTAEYVLQITLGNLSTTARECERWVSPIYSPGFDCSPENVGTQTLLVFVAAGCDADLWVWRGDFEGGTDLSIQTPEFGDWRVDFWQQGAGDPVVPVVIPASVNFEFAEVCGEVEEFVPEPGTMLLLGSGLAGLAGYATLRLRSR